MTFLQGAVAWAGRSFTVAVLGFHRSSGFWLDLAFKKKYRNSSRPICLVDDPRAESGYRDPAGDPA
jgi:hypothetical protein